MHETIKENISLIKDQYQRIIGDNEFLANPKVKVIGSHLLAIFAFLSLPADILTTPLIAFFVTLLIAKYAIDDGMRMSKKELAFWHVLQAIILGLISPLTLYGIIVAWLLSAYVIFETDGNLDAY